MRVRSKPKRALGRSGRKERERLGLALDHCGLELFVIEDTLGRAIRLLRAGDAVDRCHSLQARGSVDDVAGDHALALLGFCAQRHHRLTGVDADPHLQGEHRIGLVQLGDRLEDRERGPDSPLGIVLMRNGRAEDGHDRVAYELLDSASVGLDLGA